MTVSPGSSGARVTLRCAGVNLLVHQADIEGVVPAMAAAAAAGRSS